MEFLQQIVNGPVIFAAAIILLFVLRENHRKWNVALRHFNTTRDHAVFRDNLIPLSRQKLNIVVEMKAQVNLTWVYSYLGQSDEAKSVCRQVIEKNKNLIGTTMAYTVLVQELMLEHQWEEAKKVWTEAMEIGDADGLKAPTESFKLHLFGYILRQEYEQGLQMLLDPPRQHEHWAQESEAGIFWTWYLYRVLERDTALYEQKLQELPLKHQGMVRAMENMT